MMKSPSDGQDEQDNPVRCSSMTSLGTQHKAATKPTPLRHRQDKSLVGQVVPTKVPQCLDHPQQHKCSGIQPQQHRVTGTHPQQHKVSGIQPQQHRVTGIHPQQRRVTGIHPQQRRVTGIHPQQRRVTGIHIPQPVSFNGSSFNPYYPTLCTISVQLRT